MGTDLFHRFPDQVAAADSILGYSVRDLCLHQDEARLRQTEYAQSALFVVNALAYLARAAESEERPDFLAGHSLGEYNALFAAGCFDFETGVWMVQKRGELMAQVDGGAMLAVVGLPAEGIRALVEWHGLTELEIANYNAPSQVVLSGPRAAINAVAEAIGREKAARCLPLNVSAAFHSRHMAEAAAAFEEHLGHLAVADPRLPVISNVTARPYEVGTVRRLLGRQISSPVRWWESMQYLIEQGVSRVEEIGPGRVLSGLWRAARKAAPGVAPGPGASPAPAGLEVEPLPPGLEIRPNGLGSAEFRRDYSVRYAYLAGSMYRGIASADLVIRMAKGGLMGFFGAGGLGLRQIEEAIGVIQSALGPSGRYGMNLLYSADDPGLEEATVALYLRHGVRFVEAAGYTQITPPLVWFRFSGAHRDAAGRPVAVHRVVGKASRPEVAAAFMRPPPEAIVERLVQQGRLTAEEARVAAVLPVSDDLCVEADSGGHTDGGVALTLIPAMVSLRDEIAAEHSYPKRIRVGAAGGIGAPEAVAAAFVLGADFVLTGSVNQCSPEAGTSPAVKEILAQLDVQDTTHAPAGDFELGARVQVVRKGTLFPARAGKLYQLYRRYGSLEQIDPAARRTLEERYFKRSLEEVWRDTRERLAAGRTEEIERAQRNPKRKMALVFKWYFAHSTRVAMEGVEGERVNYQIQCGPAMGAFNRFVRGTELEDWRRRHVDSIAAVLMEGGAAVLRRSLRALAPARASSAPGSVQD